MNSQRNKTVILVVDDSDLIRHSLKNFFSDYNFNVITCLDGLDGIQKAILHKPSLILLDLLMPNLDGVKTLQVLKMIEDLKNIPVIIISGNTSKRNVLAAMEAGADRVVSKPIQKDALLKSINEILGIDISTVTKDTDFINDEDGEEIRKQLQSFFIKSFAVKRHGIAEAIQTKNIELIKAIIHEIKGTGSTIGFPKLTELSTDIEKLLSKKPIDWSTIYLNSEMIFNIVHQLETNLLTNV